MGSKQPRQYYCRCGTHLAKDNTGRQCARCQHESRDKLITPPQVPPEFWNTEQFTEALTAQHMGRVSRAYRTHPDHYPVYGPHGISQTLLGQWLGLSQAQVSRFETGPPLQYLDTLRRWAQVIRIPPTLLWFQMPQDTDRLLLPGGPATNGGRTLWHPNDGGQHPDDVEHDPVLVAPWNHRGTVEVAILLSNGGGRVKRRVFLALTGPALTTPAHHWLVHEPEIPEMVTSGLNGQRVSGELVDRFNAMVPELRRMDDVAGGGGVLSMAQQAFGWVAGLLDQASYDERTGQALHVVLAELGQLCAWAACDGGQYGLAQRYNIAALRAAHSADNRPLGAHILAAMANHAARHGQPAEGVTFVETALAGVQGQATPALLAELYIWQAMAFATLRDTSACTAAISQARAQAEQLRPDDDPSWLYWLDPTAITITAGNCHLLLDHAEQGAALLDEGVAELDHAFARDRQLHLTQLAEARSRPGKQQDLEAAAGLGLQSLELAESLNSTRGTALLRDLYRQMKPHDTVPAVRSFLERVKGVG